MINVKDAVNSVIAYMRDFSQYMPNSDQRLEEVAYDDEDHEWIIVVSFRENLLSATPRLYKRFRIGAENGEVKSMQNERPT